MTADAIAEQPAYNHLVVWKLKYFAWSLEESVLTRERLAANGVRLSFQ